MLGSGEIQSFSEIVNRFSAVLQADKGAVEAYLQRLLHLDFLVAPDLHLDIHERNLLTLYWQRIPTLDLPVATGPGKLLERGRRLVGRVCIRLPQRIEQIRTAVVEEVVVGHTRLERGWIAHVRELKTMIETLTCTGMLTLTSRDGIEVVAEQLTDISVFLLNSYVHMTNNRLGLSAADETYLAYLVKHGLEQQLTL
jgi:hypothetical protein